MVDVLRYWFDDVEAMRLDHTTFVDVFELRMFLLQCNMFMC